MRPTTLLLLIASLFVLLIVIDGAKKHREKNHGAIPLQNSQKAHKALIVGGQRIAKKKVKPRHKKKSKHNNNHVRHDEDGSQNLDESGSFGNGDGRRDDK
ncbi:hypothetical protein DdX_14873 [Ditylenchus destructor]|uniref:Secreted protein n=1 Tax=Ditylenchus destructor TaxID=166010 RepID=A0AAD4QV84_9BILA|nr:hypothetical protein DdX_14873 [Ditylenchus destructor]